MINIFSAHVGRPCSRGRYHRRAVRVGASQRLRIRERRDRLARAELPRGAAPGQHGAHRPDDARRVHLHRRALRFRKVQFSGPRFESFANS